VRNSIALLLSVNAWLITGQATSEPDLSQKEKRVKANFGYYKMKMPSVKVKIVRFFSSWISNLHSEQIST
jgi:hypothetical protein